LNISEMPFDSKLAKDVSSIGHWGTGQTEVKFTSLDDLGEVISIIKLAYAKAPK